MPSPAKRGLLAMPGKVTHAKRDRSHDHSQLAVVAPGRAKSLC
jgi:hypothetical protein